MTELSLTDSITENKTKPNTERADTPISKNKEKLQNAIHVHLGDIPLKDPLLVQTIGLNTDMYAISWTALRFDVWDGVDEFRGQKVTLLPENITWLKVRFLFFISLVTLTVSILLIETLSNDLYTPAAYTIILLRISLVAWTQKLLYPEFNQGICMMRWAIKHSDKFIAPSFAVFIPICQIMIATLTLTSIVLFICMADTSLELIMNFAGLAVISELDDWIGDLIIFSSPCQTETKIHKDEMFDLHDINSKMSLDAKLSYLQNSLEIIDDQNWEFSEHTCLKYFSYVVYSIPWDFFPLITLPINYLLLKVQKHHGSISLTA